MSRGRILFLYFTQPNYVWVSPVERELRRIGFDTELVPGFDYEVASGKLPVWQRTHETYKTLLGRQWISTLPFFEPSKLVCPELAAFLERVDLFALGQTVATHAAALKVFLQDQKFDLVVLPEDTDYARGRVGAKVCSDLGLRTAVLFPLYYNLFRSFPLYPSGLVSNYGVMNQAMAGRLIQAGVPTEGIQVTGVAGLDGHRPIRRPNLPALWLLQGKPNEYRLARLFSRVLGELGIELWVRPHPRVRRPDFEVEGAHWVDPNRPLSDYLDRVGIVVGQTSGGLVQALSVGLPALFVHFDFGPSPFDLSGGLEPLRIETPSQFRDALLAWRANSLAWDSGALFGGQGTSLTRTVNWISDLLSVSARTATPTQRGETRGTGRSRAPI